MNNTGKNELLYILLAPKEGKILNYIFMSVKFFSPAVPKHIINLSNGRAYCNHTSVYMSVIYIYINAITA